MRRALDVREFEIDLHDFIARNLATVGDCYICADWLAGRNSLRWDIETAVAEGRVAESVSEQIKRLATEVAVGPVGHPVIFKVGQLVDAGVERNWQPSCGIVFAAQCFSNCCSALFTGVPCFKNGVGVPVDPVDSQGTPIHENNGQRLSGGCHCFHQFFFRLGKIDAGAIATEESRLGDRHFFSFELTCDAHDGDNGIRIFRRCDGFRRRPAAVFRPNQFRMGLAVSAAVGDLERDLAALLKVNATDAR